MLWLLANRAGRRTFCPSQFCAEDIVSIFKRRFLSANKVKRYEAHPLVSRDSDAQHQRYQSTNSDGKPYEMVDFDVLDDPVKLLRPRDLKPP